MTIPIISLEKTVTSPATHVQRGQEWLKKATEVIKVKQLIKEYEKIETQLMAELKLLSDNIPSRSGNFVLDCIIKKGNIDYSKIPQLKDLDLEPYRKESIEVWKLSMQVELI